MHRLSNMCSGPVVSGLFLDSGTVSPCILAWSFRMTRYSFSCLPMDLCPYPPTLWFTRTALEDPKWKSLVEVVAPHDVSNVLAMPDRRSTLPRACPFDFRADSAPRGPRTPSRDARCGRRGDLFASQHFALSKHVARTAVALLLTEQMIRLHSTPRCHACAPWLLSAFRYICSRVLSWSVSVCCLPLLGPSWIQHESFCASD